MARDRRPASAELARRRRLPRRRRGPSAGERSHIRQSVVAARRRLRSGGYGSVSLHARAEDILPGGVFARIHGPKRKRRTWQPAP